VTGALFRRLPVRHKLVVMIMLTSATVLVLASIGYLVNDYLRTREELRGQLETQANLVLENSVASIDFADRQGALDTIRTLSENRYLQIACLYDTRGRLFVEFTADADAPCAAGRRRMATRMRSTAWPSRARSGRKASSRGRSTCAAAFQ
jgi:hypothetical protein